MRWALPLLLIECSRLLDHNEQLFSELDRLKFDIAIVDGIFLMKCLYLVPHRLHIPWITFTDAVEPALVNYSIPYIISYSTYNIQAQGLRDDL